jgi:hypothetical protein
VLLYALCLLTVVHNFHSFQAPSFMLFSTNLYDFVFVFFSVKYMQAGVISVNFLPIVKSRVLTYHYKQYIHGLGICRFMTQT